MKRLLLILLSSIMSFLPVRAQKTDRFLMENISFPDSVSTQAGHPGLCVRAARAVKDQLVGDCYFIPDCPAFFHDSVRKYGFIRSLVFMSDRILRCNRIGMAGHYFIEADRKIHEGPDAYMPVRKRRR